MRKTLEQQIRELDFWKGGITLEPIEGGITNQNFVVIDQGKKFFVRMGDDIPLHGVMRFNELEASIAAAKVGLSPAVAYHAPGVLILNFIEGKTLTEAEIRQDVYLERILPMLHTCHRELAQQIRGPALIFWVFHVIRDYLGTLQNDGSRSSDMLPRLQEKGAVLEAAVGSVDIVYGHNDLLAANFIDDGNRLWLVDWDYAGYNSPLFDLANLASNNSLSRNQEDWLLQHYFNAPISDQTRHGFEAMKCASLLRETLWSMVSEIHSQLDFDFVAYTRENLERFEQQWNSFSA